MIRTTQVRSDAASPPDAQTFYLSVDGSSGALDTGLTEDLYAAGNTMTHDPFGSGWEHVLSQDMAFTAYVRPT